MAKKKEDLSSVTGDIINLGKILWEDETTVRWHGTSLVVSAGGFVKYNELNIEGAEQQLDHLVTCRAGIVQELEERRDEITGALRSAGF